MSVMMMFLASATVGTVVGANQNRVILWTSHETRLALTASLIVRQRPELALEGTRFRVLIPLHSFTRLLPLHECQTRSTKKSQGNESDRRLSGLRACPVP